MQRAVVIHEGAPLSQEKMLQSQRNLYDLGVFNEVQTAIQDPEGVESAQERAVRDHRKRGAGRSTTAAEWKLEPG